MSKIQKILDAIAERGRVRTFLFSGLVVSFLFGVFWNVYHPELTRVGDWFMGASGVLFALVAILPLLLFIHAVNGIRCLILILVGIFGSAWFNPDGPPHPMGGILWPVSIVVLILGLIDLIVTKVRYERRFTPKVPRLGTKEPFKVNKRAIFVHIGAAGVTFIVLLFISHFDTVMALRFLPALYGIFALSNHATGSIMRFAAKEPPLRRDNDLPQNIRTGRLVGCLMMCAGGIALCAMYLSAISTENKMSYIPMFPLIFGFGIWGHYKDRAKLFRRYGEDGHDFHELR